VCDWARLKFGLTLTVADLKDKMAGEVKALLHQKVMELYRQKETEFPVEVGMARFMADRQRGPGPGQRYDREGLYRWAAERFPGLVALQIGDGTTVSMVPQAPSHVRLTEEDFRTQSRSRLQEVLLQASRERYPRMNEEAIDAKLDEAFSGTQFSEKE